MTSFGEAVRWLNTARNPNLFPETNPYRTWDQFQSGIELYCKHFNQAIDIPPFLSAPPGFVVDLFSGGQFVHEIVEAQLAQGGISLGLSDPRSDEEKSWDNQHQVAVLPANIMYGDTFAQLATWIKTHQPQNPKYRLALANAGLTYQKTLWNHLRWPLLERFFWETIDILDPHGGTLVCDVPYFTPQETSYPRIWAEAVNNNQLGVHITFHPIGKNCSDRGLVLKAVRNPDGNPNNYRRFTRDLELPHLYPQL